MEILHWQVRTPEDRVDIINWAILESVCGPDVAILRRLLAQEILGPSLAHKDHEQAEAIFRWHKSHVWYLEDPISFDFYPTAQILLWMGAGDCDDHTILGCSLCALAGFSVGVRTIRTEAGWHVYGLVGLPKASPEIFVPYDAAWREALELGDEYPPDQTDIRLDFTLDLRAGRI